MKHTYSFFLTVLTLLLNASTANANSWLQWCCGKRKKSLSERDLRAEMMLNYTILQEQRQKDLAQLRIEIQRQIDNARDTAQDTGQHINTLLSEYQNTIEQRVQTLLGKHQENTKKYLQNILSRQKGQASAQPTGRLSGNVRAVAQTPRFTQKDVIGDLSEKLALLFAVCKAHQSPSNSPQLPRGILFEGPPGAGKSFIAEALAGETQFLYFYQSASDMHGEYANDGTIFVKEYFADVRQQAQTTNKPAIVVIDELDGVGLNRDSLGHDSASFSNRKTLLQLMIELAKPHDTTQQPIIVIGITNCVHNLDPALKRKGRFNKIIHFQLPSSQQYLQAIRHYKNKYERCKRSPEDSASIKSLSTRKFSLADIDYFFEEADLRAWVAGAEIATPEHYQQALRSLIEEKQIETSEGLKHEREELLKDLPLINTYYRTRAGNLNLEGKTILRNRLCKLMPQQSLQDKFWGSTKRPSTLEYFFAER